MSKDGLRSRLMEDSSAPTKGLTAEETKKAESTVQKFQRRLIMGLLLFGAFTSIIWAGASYICILIIVCQCVVFKELVGVRYARYQREKTQPTTSIVNVPLFRTLQWWWFCCAMFFYYGDFVHMFAARHSDMAWLAEKMHVHTWVSFVLFSSAFVMSILTLRVDSVRYQMGHLGWTVVSLVLVCAQMMRTASMVHRGVFWFFFPAWLVIQNDCWAYFCGLAAGRKVFRRPFLAISPNKTWEGFLGSLIITVVVSYFSADWFSNSPSMICPSRTLTLVPHPNIDCDTPSIFEKQPVDMTFLSSLLPGLIPQTIECKPIQLHALVLGLFASLVAPFGGFMASAIKRAHGVKDFSSIIPGHGGFTDRFDCQMLMALYAWVHYSCFVDQYTSPVESVLEALHRLPIEDQRTVLDALTQSLG